MLRELTMYEINFVTGADGTEAGQTIEALEAQARDMADTAKEHDWQATYLASQVEKGLTILAKGILDFFMGNNDFPTGQSMQELVNQAEFNMANGAAGI